MNISSLCGFSMKPLTTDDKVMKLITLGNKFRMLFLSPIFDVGYYPNHKTGQQKIFNGVIYFKITFFFKYYRNNLICPREPSSIFVPNVDTTTIYVASLQQMLPKLCW